MTAFLLFILRYRTVGTLFRTQIYLILAAGFVPFLATLFYIFDLGPDPGFDWTPVTFVISGFALIAATLNFELFFPATPDVFSPCKDDEGWRCCHKCGRPHHPHQPCRNSSCSGYLKTRGWAGTLTRCVPGLARFIAPAGTPGVDGGEIMLPAGVPPASMMSRPLPSRLKDITRDGHILTLRDVTDRKNAETAFRKANRKLNLLSGIVRDDMKNKLTALFIYLDLV